MITGVILARNEESNILECLEKLRPHVGEIILIDMESSDRTVELAQPQVDKVLTHSLVPNFDPARNIAIPEAKFEWLWFVDADERIPEMTGRLVNKWIRTRGDEFEIINIPFKNHFCGQWMRHCGWWSRYTRPSVMKRGFFEWPRQLHGGVRHWGREIRVARDEGTAIQHFGFESVEHWVTKNNRYTSTEAGQLAERNVHWDWRDALRAMVHDLWEHYELFDAKLDGNRGWILTWLASQYRWLSYAKLIDQPSHASTDRAIASVPESLDEVFSAMEQELAVLRSRTPRLPLGVVWRCPIWHRNASAESARLSVRALARGERPLTLEVLDGAAVDELDSDVRALFQALIRSRRGTHVVTVTSDVWPSPPPDRCSCWNIFRPPLDVNRFGAPTPDSLRSLNDYDELWCESPKHRDELVHLGAAPERIRIVALSQSDKSAGNDGDVRLNHVRTSIEKAINSVESRFSSIKAPPPREGRNTTIRRKPEVGLQVDENGTKVVKGTASESRSSKPITGVILARNEESNILECLEKFRPHVGEIILIDMESSDHTVELAQPLVDRVLTHAFMPNFDSARNIAIEVARFDWMWFVDADERIPDRTGKLVNDLIRDRGDEFEAIHIPFKSYFCGKWIEHCCWWPGYTGPRVLKRGHFEFATRLHGGVKLKGRELQLPPDPDIGVDHYSYRDIAHHVTKSNAYTSTEAMQLHERGVAWDWREATRAMMHDLWLFYEANDGALDRERGWILSWLTGQYRWLSYAKLFDLDRPRYDTAQRPNIPQDLDEALQCMEDSLAEFRARTPELPLGVVIRSPVWERSDIAAEGRRLAKAVATGGRELAVRSTDASIKEKSRIPDNDDLLLRALTRARRPKYSLSIHVGDYLEVEPDPTACFNVVRFAWDSDRLPKKLAKKIGQFNEVWAVSQQAFDVLRRSWIPPERIQVVRSSVDVSIFRPDGAVASLPNEFADRFVFLTVLSRGLIDGWDVLLRAYLTEFRAEDATGLLIVTPTGDMEAMERYHCEFAELMKTLGINGEERGDIVLATELTDSEARAATYRAVNAFVLPTRGNDWGRSCGEAMASGLPIVATLVAGDAEFMNASSCHKVSTSPIEIPDSAHGEFAPHDVRGHLWNEPNQNELQEALRRVFSDRPLRERVQDVAVQEVERNHSNANAARTLERAIVRVEDRFRKLELSEPKPAQIRVTWEGDLFALHSFSNINEKLALEFSVDESIALNIDRTTNYPTYDEEVLHAYQLKPYCERKFEHGPQITIRHAFPPNWETPAQGRWVHIQPWEYVFPPADWVEPLRDRVDEIWVPSSFVKRGYVRSGIPEEKIRVISWGVSPDVFHPGATALLLPTDKSFRFLFVGGTTGRKGFDRLLNAYLEEFGPNDDVCLVIKDMGADSFYQKSTLRDHALAARDNPNDPEIIYIDQRLTEGQMASLYTACDCLVHPYRGEGFGLPILEAMACGVAPIVPDGGASADFVSTETAYLLPSRMVPAQHELNLCGPAEELSVELEDLRRTMRNASSDQRATKQLGDAASQYVRENLTWSRTADQMKKRIAAFANQDRANAVEVKRSMQDVVASSQPQRGDRRGLVTVCMVTRNVERELANCLARVAPFVDQIVVADLSSVDRTASIAREYGADVYVQHDGQDNEVLRQFCLSKSVCDWVLWLTPQDALAAEDAQDIPSLLEQVSPQVGEFRVEL